MEVRKSRWKIRHFILISLLGHALVFLLFNKAWQPPTQEPQAVYVELDPATMQQALNQAKQIVQSEAAAENKITPDAKYLSERDQAVEKQTKARTVDRFRSADQRGSEAKGRSGTKGLSLKDLAANDMMDPATPKEAEGEKVAKQKKQNAGDGGSAGSASSDYLRDVAEGDRTMLSTREFKYFGYHQRIRDRLEVAWNSRLRAVWTNYVMGGRRPAGQHDYVTKVFVVMDRHGSVVAVKVLEESGARDLDRAAVEAFNQIGPFPDPPSGIVEADGTIKIPWSFVVSL